VTRPVRVAVLGGGSWGTTVASLAASNAPTVLWMRDADAAAEVNEEHRNSRYLKDLPLDPALRATASLQEAVETADVLVIGVPTHAFRGVLEDVREHVRAWTPVLSLSKGLEDGTRLRMTEVVEDVMPGHPAGALAGPNLAAEVLQGYAAAAVVAMRDERLAASLQRLFAARMFRVYTNSDVAGIELGGALKNVIAIAAGMAEGLGVGDNTRAAVMTRGLAEIMRLGIAMGGDARTFAGLAGMGDLIATCMSPLSRNRRLGYELAQGRTLEEILADMGQVAEGAKTCRVVVEIAEELEVPMPVSREVQAVVHEQRRAEVAFRGLMRTQPSSEIHGETW
jgi:glycerol-3-phosphate dehydrogenase (NAD(P)+)